MPRVMLALPQEAITVTRTVVREAVKQLLTKTNFPDGVEIVFQEEMAGAHKQLKNFFNSDADGGIRTPYHNYAFLTFKEEFTEDALNQSRWQDVYYTDTFADKEHDIYMRPYYADAKVELNIKIRSNNLTALNSWIAAFRANHAMRSLTFKHRLPYEVDIPAPYLDFLYTAWEMKEKVDSDGEELGDYLRRCFREGLAKRSTLSGNVSDVIIHEVQENVVGRITEEFFYNTKEISSGIYELNIPYTFNYQKPLSMGLNFPAFIRNQRIPERYIREWLPRIDRDTDVAEIPGYTVDFDGYLKPAFYLGDGGTRMIEWDDWFPDTYYQGTQTVSIIPIQVDLEDRKKCFNLWDIPEKYVPRPVLEFLRDFNDLQGRYRDSIVGLEIFAIGNKEDSIAYDLDADLNLSTKADMNPKERNYLRIYLFKDLSLFSSKRTKELLANPTLSMGIFKLYDPTVELTEDPVRAEKELPQYLLPGRNRDIPSLLFAPNGKFITGRSYTFWLKKLKDTNDLFVNLKPKTDHGVGFYHIIARRRT